MNLRLAIFLILAVSVGTAAPLCTTTSNITNYNGTGGCERVGLLFSGFVLTTAGAGASGPEAVFQIDQVGTWLVTFNVNNNQGSGVGVQTQTLTFNIAQTTPDVFVVGASTSNGGSPATTIRQVVCAGTINAATGACTGTLLQDVTNVGGTATPTVLFLPQSNVNVWRLSTTPALTTITGSSFDFAATPEPATMALFGSGLLALGWIRKKRA